MLSDDPTIKRIREARIALSEKFNHDPKKIVEYYINLQKKLPPSRFKLSPFEKPNSKEPTEN